METGRLRYLRLSSGDRPQLERPRPLRLCDPLAVEGLERQLVQALWQGAVLASGQPGRCTSVRVVSSGLVSEVSMVSRESPLS